MLLAQHPHTQTTHTHTHTHFPRAHTTDLARRSTGWHCVIMMCSRSLVAPTRCMAVCPWPGWPPYAELRALTLRPAWCLCAMPLPLNRVLHCDDELLADAGRPAVLCPRRHIRGASRCAGAGVWPGNNGCSIPAARAHARATWTTWCGACAGRVPGVCRACAGHIMV